MFNIFVLLIHPSKIHNPPFTPGMISDESFESFHHAHKREAANLSSLRRDDSDVLRNDEVLQFDWMHHPTDTHSIIHIRPSESFESVHHVYKREFGNLSSATRDDDVLRNDEEVLHFDWRFMVLLRRWRFELERGILMRFKGEWNE